VSQADPSSLILPCVRGEIRRTFTHMAIDSLRTLAEVDLVVTQDGWVVKDRFGPGNRWATEEEMTRAREESA
jgi:hypothetical protein